jgi:hypothetical protein
MCALYCLQCEYFRRIRITLHGLLVELTNYMYESCSEADDRSALQEIPHLS